MKFINLEQLFEDETKSPAYFKQWDYHGDHYEWRASDKYIEWFEEKLEELTKQQIFDMNGKILKKGDIFDIHQTVNGYSEFYAESIIPLDIRYNKDRTRKYEYCLRDLLDLDKEEVEFEIISREVL